MPSGRPSTYTEKIAAAICERLAAGESLRTICKSDDLPDRVTVMRWAAQRESFATDIARARDAGFEAVAEEIVGISDEQHEVARADGTLFDPEVNRDKLRVHARQWYLSKLAPKRYGDRLEIDGKLEVDVATRIVAARKRAGTGD